MLEKIFNYGSSIMDFKSSFDEKSKSRLYIGNLDLRITEAALISMFSPFGKIISENFLWHTRGAKRGEPRGYAFIEFSSKDEAKLAREKMHGRMACGRPLVVRLASEKYPVEGQSKFGAGEGSGSSLSVGCSLKLNRTAKIVAIKNKLKAIEEENDNHSKKLKQEKVHVTDFGDDACSSKR